MNRRQFLTSITALTIAPRALSRAARITSAGVQLVSVREQIGPDPEPMISALSNLGFSEIEVWVPASGAPTAADLRRAMDKHGVSSPSRHWSPRDVGPGNLDRVLAECKVLGNKFLVVAALPANQRSTLDGYKRAAEWFNDAGKAAQEQGIQFAFHSEAFDFPPQDGVVPFDYLIEHTNPQLVRFQLDTANIIKGGRNPVDYIQRLGKRTFSMHIKDTTATGERIELGKGIVALRDVLRTATDAGISYFIIEDERPGLGYSHIQAAYAHLRSVGF
jgi:sugar phosphate isomerase/epimerase